PPGVGANLPSWAVQPSLAEQLTDSTADRPGLRPAEAAWIAWRRWQTICSSGCGLTRRAGEENGWCREPGRYWPDPKRGQVPACRRASKTRFGCGTSLQRFHPWGRAETLTLLEDALDGGDSLIHRPRYEDGLTKTTASLSFPPLAPTGPEVSEPGFSRL